ncbi:hypothetical protein [Hyphomonas beringensis]|uniref:hypothetical protein n=1 Tax=Hyphomonas beringensis TaxID=1280946 RepID=UPI0012DF9515|nr:hypothetical protein [Hyphomonas beringensis]
MRNLLKFSGLNRDVVGLALICFMVSCSSPEVGTNENSTQSSAEHNSSVSNSPRGDFVARADEAARQLIEDLGAQQTFARLGWQQNPDYKPPQHCFDYWLQEGDQALQEAEIEDCEAHASDLSRLYDSYGTDAEPIVFKSRYYWDELETFGLQFPQLVTEWEAKGGSEDDPSFLDHPVCAKPLQEGWEGSDYFYDGAEHPLCRLYKIDPVAATQ